MSDADYGLQHLQRVTELANRSAPEGVAVLHHRYDYLAFGSFVLEVGRRRQRLQFIWDGRDFSLEVSVAHASANEPNPQWRNITRDVLGEEPAASYQAIAEFIRREYGLGSG